MLCFNRGRRRYVVQGVPHRVLKRDAVDAALREGEARGREKVLRLCGDLSGVARRHRCGELSAEEYRVSVAIWREAMRRLLRGYALNGVAAGCGGFGSMKAEDYRRASAWHAGQLRALDGLAQVAASSAALLCGEAAGRELFAGRAASLLDMDGGASFGNGAGLERANFNVMQPRDERGRWTGGSGAGANSRKHKPLLPMTGDKNRPGGGREYSREVPRYNLGVEPGRERHLASIMSTVADGLRASSIDSGKQEQYKAALQSVFPLMTENSLERVARHVKKVSFYSSVQELTAKVAPVSKKTYIGAYDPSDYNLHLDGEYGTYSAEEIYAHELAHAVDGPRKEISKSDEWIEAWQEEIVQMRHAKLSQYAIKNSAEGFAEFGRLVYGGTNPATIRKAYPKCFEVWKSHNLVD